MIQPNTSWWAAIALTILTSCTTGPILEHTASLEEPAPPPPAAITPPPPPVIPCETLPAPYGSAPVWLGKQGFVVTRFLKACKTPTGTPGFRPASPWVAMGFPCTAGQGRIEVTGHYYAPKMVSLSLDTDCPMLPATLAAVEKGGATTLKLAKEAKLAAINPFAVQYWEIPGYATDADVGVAITLRSIAAKRQLWKEFLEGSPIKLRLFGRENAWGSPHFFVVTAALIYTGPYTFKLRVDQVELMSATQTEEVRSRCERLQPRRHCAQIFS